MKPSNTISLSSPLTYSDWLLKDNPPAFGQEGVRTMLENCKQFGFDKIYWRVFDAGKSTYQSQLVEPFKGKLGEVNHYNLELLDWPDPEMLGKLEAINFSNFDSLKAAVQIGHELGLEIHAWMTINEDDHGVGWESRFSREHPEFRWVRRDGRPFHSQLSYAFEEVRKYKLGLVKEMLNYDIDGIFLDWMRTGDIRDNPQNDPNGVVDYGYEQPNIDKFKQAYGVNPLDVSNSDKRWVACRAKPVTEFMRQVKDVVNKHTKELPISVMVQHPWSYRGVLPFMTDNPKLLRMSGNTIDGALNGLLCDVKTWASEKLIDEIVAAGYYIGEGTAEKAYRYLQDETEGLVPVWLYGWVPTKPEAFAEDIQLAHKVGTQQILFWEADYIDSIPEPERSRVIEAIQDFRKS